MNTAGLIVLALVGGALTILVVLSLSFLGFALWRVDRSLAVDKESRVTQAVEAKAAAVEMKVAANSAVADVAMMLTQYQNELRTTISKIDGDSLQTAAARGLEACVRMERVAVALQKMLIAVDDEPEPRGSKLAPEEYAPDDNGTIYNSQSAIARADADADEEEYKDAFSN